jgi:hypothetical protein
MQIRGPQGKMSETSSGIEYPTFELISYHTISQSILPLDEYTSREARETHSLWIVRILLI